MADAFGQAHGVEQEAHPLQVLSDLAVARVDLDVHAFLQWAFSPVKGRRAQLCATSISEKRFINIAKNLFFVNENYVGLGF